jgi:hypothetical protein
VETNDKYGGSYDTILLFDALLKVKVSMCLKKVYSG